MFYNEKRNTEKYIDNVFTVVQAAKADNDPNKINGTAGCLAGEDGQLAAFKVVFDSYNQVDERTKASYAQSPMGNAAFNKAMLDYVIEGRIKHIRNVATAGGTGALTLALRMCANYGDNLIAPDIAWGNYRTIAKDIGMHYVAYDAYNLDSMFKAIDEQTNRVILLINSPCQNPCGLSYSKQEWENIITKINNCGKEVILLNDVAYMDFSYDLKVKDYFDVFNHLNDKVLTIIAYSCSKTFSYYGMRLGTAFIINNNEDFLDDFINQAGQYIRTNYSNVSNSAMVNIADVLNNHKDEFLKEKAYYVDLLKQRSALFMKEADECSLAYYPYKDGFFITLKMENNELRDAAHAKLAKNHIYTIKTNLGIRVGICSIPLEKIKGLATKIKEIIA